MKIIIFYDPDKPSGVPAEKQKTPTSLKLDLLSQADKTSNHTTLNGLRQKITAELIAEKQKLLPPGFKLEADGRIVGQRTGTVYATVDIKSLSIGRDLNQDLIIRDKNQSYTYSPYSNTLDKTPVSDIVPGLPELEHVNGRGISISSVDRKYFSISGDTAKVSIYIGQSETIKLPTKDTKTLRVVEISANNGGYFLYNSSGELFEYMGKGEIRKINIPTRLYGFHEYVGDGSTISIIGQNRRLYDPFSGKEVKDISRPDSTTIINYGKMQEKN